MPTIIAHHGRMLHITIENGEKATVYYINKQQIRLIENHDEETIRINVGNGALKPIYIRASDITNPANLTLGKNARNYLVELCKDDDAGLPTLDNQVGQSETLEAMRSLLGDIKTALVVYNPANIFNQPLITDNSVAGTTYSGYAVAGTAVNATGWAIKKAVVSGGSTTILWAYGNLNLTNVWNNRTTFTYSSVTLP